MSVDEFRKYSYLNTLSPTYLTYLFNRYLVTALANFRTVCVGDFNACMGQDLMKLYEKRQIEWKLCIILGQSWRVAWIGDLHKLKIITIFARLSSQSSEGNTTWRYREAYWVCWSSWFVDQDGGVQTLVLRKYPAWIGFPAVYSSFKNRRNPLTKLYLFFLVHWVQELYTSVFSKEYAFWKVQ
jgi:hypothetical protein